MSAPEQIDDPHDQCESETQNDAGDDGKVKAAVTALVRDVNREAPESKGKSRTKKEKRPGAHQQNTDDEEQLAKFAERIRGCHRLSP